ncbi:MAG: SH3 domain-containing protein [Anaerolinea sp.]|nr:SH3 domain-containing protein [Anaerolinea sp.]
MFIAVLVILGMTGTVYMQSVPTVAFIEERDLQMASVTDNGPDGLTRLAALFQQQGASTGFIRLDDPIPEGVRVVVLVRPRRALSAEYLSRIWVHLERGGSLLLALDPVGQGGNPDTQGGGVDRLFGQAYGVRLLNGLIVEPWFTNETAQDVRRSAIYAQANAIDHPVIQPLQDYGVPVLMWGARGIRSEFFAPYSSASGLLYIDGFGENNPQIYRAEDPAPLTPNIGADDQGRLIVGALAENASTQSRLALFGDGELFQNDYGLAPIPGTQTPLHAGNYVLIQRTISWLLGLPVEEWRALPSGFTWLQIDGVGDDWGTQGAITTDAEDDTTIRPQNIRQVRAFRNQDYLYLQVETLSPPEQFARLLLDVDGDVNGELDRSLSADLDQITVAEGDATAPVPDGVMAIRQIIELRLPLRVTGAGGIVPRICLTTAREMAFPVEPDCIENVPAPFVDQHEPSGLQLPNAILASVTVNGNANIRAGAGTEFNAVGSIPNGEIVAVVGRNEAGDWIRIQTARYDGWMNAALLHLTTSVDLLPVLP